MFSILNYILTFLIKVRILKLDRAVDALDFALMHGLSSDDDDLGAVAIKRTHCNESL
jgi:hypothetical protein